eukprot:XP_016660097.1 PREDICTED: uncharacterized protein LOC107883824 [Acyrthosiphon pisum]
MADSGQATRGSRSTQIPRLTRAIRIPKRRHPHPPDAQTSEVPTNAGQQSQCMHKSNEPLRGNTPVAILRRDEDQIIKNELSDEEFLSGCNLSLPDTDDEGL